MASLFDELDAGTQSAHEDVFGEAIRVEPREKSQYTERAADPSRPVRENVRAVVSIAFDTDNFIGQRTGVRIDTSSRLAQAPAEVWMTAAAYAALGYELRKEDALVRTDKPGSPRFAISRVIPGDAGGVTLILTAE